MVVAHQTLMNVVHQEQRTLQLIPHPAHGTSIHLPLSTTMLLLVAMVAITMATAVEENVDSVSTQAMPTFSKRHVVTILVTGLLTRFVVFNKTMALHSTVLTDSLLPWITSTTGTTMPVLVLAVAIKMVHQQTAVAVLTGMKLESKFQEILKNVRIEINTGLKEFNQPSNG